MSEFGGVFHFFHFVTFGRVKSTKWRAHVDEVEIGRERIGQLKAQEGACRTGFSDLGDQPRMGSQATPSPSPSISTR